jgi:hypothetical protein
MIGAWRPTAWLRMQSKAKRSQTGFSLQFAISREISANCRVGNRGGPPFSNDINMLSGLARSREQGEVFRYCREKQGELAK